MAEVEAQVYVVWEAGEAIEKPTVAVAEEGFGHNGVK